MSVYYVYALCYPNGMPFYIGKGTRNRIDEHERDLQKGKGCNTYKESVIKQIQQSGQQIVKRKIAEFTDELEAYMYEWALIHMSSHSEHLTNAHGSSIKYRKGNQFRPKRHENIKSSTGFYTTKQVAIMLNKTPETVTWLIHEGKLSATKAGSSKNSHYRISQEAVDAFFQPLEKSNKMPTKLISTKDAAKQLNIHPTTLLRAIEAGKIKAYALGRSYRVSQADLDAWIESLRVVTPQMEEDKEDGNQPA